MCLELLSAYLPFAVVTRQRSFAFAFCFPLWSQQLNDSFAPRVPSAVNSITWSVCDAFFNVLVINQAILNTAHLNEEQIVVYSPSVSSTCCV